MGFMWTSNFVNNLKQYNPLEPRDSSLEVERPKSKANLFGVS